MKKPVGALIFLLIACGCVAVTDEATGTWENKTLPASDTMVIKSDGSYIVSDLGGNELYRGEWENIAGNYIFTNEINDGKQYGGIVHGGRGQTFLIVENTTYLKI